MAKSNTKGKYNLIENANKIWEMYRKGVEYQTRTGLSTKIPECVRFYEGDQWPKETDRTKTFPRPIINVTRMICRNKKAGILSNETSIIYSCEDIEKSKKFTNFSTFITKELNQKKLDRIAIEDGCVKGTYIYHYYWDANAVGRKGNVPGGVRGEIIDPLNIFFENPTNEDEQSQKWIIIRSRLSVDTVKEMCDSGVDKQLIKSDENESRYNEKEQDESNRCTVLTRYFKVNGEVYFEKAIKGTVIVKPRPLHPDFEKAMRELLKDDTANEEGYEQENKDYTTSVANLYPIAVGVYESKDKSIFGIGEVEGIIPNQKAINLNLGLQLLNIQNVWGGKYIVHPTALRGQRITNEPGQIIVDYSGTGAGIRKITENAYNDVPLKVLDTTMSATRIVTGATEVMTGETIGANTSGAAILQLQSQALKPIEELQQSFWDTKVKIGRILEMFYKLYYEDVEYTYKVINEVSDVKVNDNGRPLERYEIDRFNGVDFVNTSFDVSVEVIAGAKGTEVSLVQSLDNLLQQGQIDIATYFELYPHNALPNKNEILEAVRNKQSSELVQLQEVVKTQQEQINTFASAINEVKPTIQNALSAIKENEQLKQLVINLQNEYNNKIKMANQQIEVGNIKYQETYNDARELARELNIATSNQGQQ